MPIYEYQCESCLYQFEQLQKMSDDILKQCPECKKPDLRKLISSAGFQLKGKGWYVTDFKNSGNSKQTENTTTNKSEAPSVSKTKAKED